jgi:predicted nucleotidyltransferase
LKPEVVEKINEIVDTFLDSLAEDNIKIDVEDIILVGSNVSYNYTKDSDLDIHILANLDNLECPDNLYPLLYSAYKSLFNKKMDINFYGIPVEVYVETDDTPLRSNGIYSVKNK